MSLPIFCSTCGDLVDTAHALTGLGSNHRSTIDTPCPGKGNHALLNQVGKACFGLLEKVRVSYIGGSATFFNYEYVGPKNRVALALALMYGYSMGIRVFLKKEIITWSMWGGFGGKGFENFRTLQNQVA